MQGKYFFDAIKSERVQSETDFQTQKNIIFDFFSFMCVYELLFSLTQAVQFFKDLRKTVLMEHCSPLLTMVMTMLVLFCENEKHLRNALLN